MADAQFYWEKVRDRNVWDFPLVNVAAATLFALFSVTAPAEAVTESEVPTIGADCVRFPPTVSDMVPPVYLYPGE